VILQRADDKAEQEKLNKVGAKDEQVT